MSTRTAALLATLCGLASSALLWATLPPTHAQPSDTRQRLIAYALGLRGISYSNTYSVALGFRPDCSGTMRYIYQQVAGVDIGSTTFDQLPRLQPIDLRDAQDGDLWYGQFPDDQHTGMLWRQPDGTWALIHNGADVGAMHVTYRFLETYLGQHTIGYRRVVR